MANETDDDKKYQELNTLMKREVAKLFDDIPLAHYFNKSLYLARSDEFFDDMICDRQTWQVGHGFVYSVVD